MRQEVRDRFISFTDPLEGDERGMYPDSVGLITVGRGYLADTGPRRKTADAPIGDATSAMAVVLPFKHRDTGALATHAEIDAEWWRLKRAWPAQQSDWAAQHSSLWLDQSDVDALTMVTLDSMWASIVKYFPDAESWPACAQLGALSMAYAMGRNFEPGYPHFDAACFAQDWAAAAAQCAMNQPPVPVKRNALNRQLFLGAAAGLAIENALA